MSWEYDRQFFARLTGSIATLAESTLTPFPTAELRTGSTWGDSLKHGTTIGALVVENGNRAVCFSDGKVSMGNMPVHLAYRKMARLDPRTVMLFSGSPTLAVQYGRMLRNWIGYREETTNAPMTARAKELAVEDLLLHGINLAHAGILLAPILVTYDPNKKRARLFNFGPEGSMTEHETFTTSGSGTNIKIRLQERWKPGLSLDEGIAMARRLIVGDKDLDKGVEDVDSFSGGKVSIDVVGPDGTETVQE